MTAIIDDEMGTARVAAFFIWAEAAASRHIKAALDGCRAEI